MQEPKLRLGYVGLVNRSQKDIDRNVTVRECLDREKVRNLMQDSRCEAMHPSLCVVQG